MGTSAQKIEVRDAVEHQIDRAPRGRRVLVDLGTVGIDFPFQPVFVTLFTVVKAANRARVSYRLREPIHRFAPVLLLVDMAQGHTGCFTGKERSQAQFVIGSGHGDAMLGDRIEHGAVAQDHRRHALRAQLAIDRRPGLQHLGHHASCSTMHIAPFSAVHGRKVSFVQGGQRVKHGCVLGVGANYFNGLEVGSQAKTADALSHCDGVARSHHGEHAQKAGRLMAEGALQHEHRTEISQALDLPGQRTNGGLMGIERMVCAIAGDDGAVNLVFDGLGDSGGKAAVRFLQVFGGIVKITHVSHFDFLHRLSFLKKGIEKMKMTHKPFVISDGCKPSYGH